MESAGKYFASVNGVPEPLIRFEGHYFDKRLVGTSKARARLRGLSSPRAGAVKNPNSQSARWQLLEKASAINRRAALESTSWGIGQVMGAHWNWLGYANVDALVKEARSGIAGQMRLMELYIEKSGLVGALQIKDWSSFARGYNGPAFAQNGYHLKLARAYANAKSEPIVLPKPSPTKTEVNQLRLGDSGEHVLDLQKLLSALGFSNPQNGTFDHATETAVRSFQKLNNLEIDGIAGRQTFATIESEVARYSPFAALWNWLKSIGRRFF